MTETEDERWGDVLEVTKVTRMTGGCMRREPPEGPARRRRPEGVRPLPRGIVERKEG